MVAFVRVVCVLKILGRIEITLVVHLCEVPFVAYVIIVESVEFC